MVRIAADVRRARLVDAALAVMTREGVAQATTRAITAEADMQVGAFHYCFRSKEELVIQVMETIIDRSYDAVGGALAGLTDPEEIVQAAIEAYWTHIEADPQQHLLSYELTHFAIRQQPHQDAAARQYASYTAGMEALLAGVAEAGTFTWRTPVPLLARFVLAVIEGVTFQWLATGSSEEAQATLRHLGDYLIAEIPVPA